MTDAARSDERWLRALLPFVHAQLPPAPARVVEIGCGPVGGFVPSLVAAGYDAVGVDPDAPAGTEYRRIEFEHYEVQHPADVIVACTSLHHVQDLGRVLDQVADNLLPGGTIVVIEWALESFDEASANWCFDRIATPDDEHGWLQHHRARWQASRKPWDSYLADWVRGEGLHTGHTVVEALNARFRCRLLARTPYLFSDLDEVTEAAEQAAIDAHRIRPTGIRYVGRRD